jgi:hypothetical protein
MVSPTHTSGLRFVALSYVWGDSCNTDWSTTSNILQRMTHLDPSTQPATIKDAIKVCERLGERHIWADRLCILQDDENDKSLQVQAMASICSAAKFVIVDASSDSMNDGMVGISRTRKSHVSEEFCELSINIQLSALWDVVDPSPWNSPGWTYQEAILPKRKLFFTESQIIYECALRIQHEETLAYHSFDHSMHDKINYPTTTTSLCYGVEEDGDQRLRRNNLNNRKEEKPWEAFVRHLPRYRRRKLRYTSDVLNAFSAIIDALYTEGKSYQGFPLPDLDLAFLWNIWNEPFYARRRRPVHEIQGGIPPGLLPSWSWISAPHIIPFYDDTYEKFCGSLCLWFRPDVIRGQLQPVVSDACAVNTWHRRETHRFPPAGCDYGRQIFAKVLPSMMVESSAYAEASAWVHDSSDGLTDELLARWLSYTTVWQDVFGRERDIRRTQTRILEEARRKIRDGVLFTRASCLDHRNKGNDKRNSLVPQ